MRRWNALVGLSIVAAVFAPLSGGERLSPEKAVSALGFLAGTWNGAMGGGEFVAYYSTPEGGRVLSYSELVQDGQVAFHEFERFQVADGEVVFTAFPRGKRAAADLKLTEIDSGRRRAVFENPDKDFPTRIVYHQVSPDNLVITLSDPHGGSPKVETFDLRRRP